MYYVYLLKSVGFNQIYIGSTRDLKKRLGQYNNNKSFYTRRYSPWKLVYYEAFETERLAREREKKLKYGGNAMKELKKRLALSSTGVGAGFTIVELLVVMAIAIILWGISTIVFIRPQEVVNLDATVATLTADIKSQQTKAMSGDAGLDYGIHLETNRYTLFAGSTYDPGDQNNFAVNVEDPIQITNVTLPGSNLIFQKGSGELSGFVLGEDSLSVRNVSGGEATNIVINKYGSIQKN